MNDNQEKVKEYFKIFTGGNNNVNTWTPVAIMDFAIGFSKFQKTQAKTISKEEIKHLIELYKSEELKSANEPFHYEAEMAAGLRYFLIWLDTKDKILSELSSKEENKKSDAIFFGEYLRENFVSTPSKKIWVSNNGIKHGTTKELYESEEFKISLQSKVL